MIPKAIPEIKPPAAARVSIHPGAGSFKEQIITAGL